MKLGFINPITKEGMRALAIVLGVIVVIAAVVYAANFVKKEESTIVPTKTIEGVSVAPQPSVTTVIPTVTPLIKEATSTASPSPTRKVQSPTGTQTPTIKGVIVTTAPTR